MFIYLHQLPATLANERVLSKADLEMLAASKSKKVNSPNALAFEDAYSIKAFFCIFIALEAKGDDWKIL